MTKTELLSVYDSLIEALESAGMSTREMDDDSIEVNIQGSGRVRLIVEIPTED